MHCGTPAAPAHQQVSQQLQQQAQQPAGPTGGAAGSSGDAPAAHSHSTALQQMMHTIRTEAAAQKTELATTRSAARSLKTSQ